MENLKIFVTDITLFIVFQVFVDMLISEKKFKKYVRLIMGLVLVLIISQPIAKFILSGYESFDELLIFNESFIDSKTYDRKIDELDNLQDELIFKNYKIDLRLDIEKQLAKNMENLQVVEMNISVVEDKEAENFAQIDKIDIKALLLEENKKDRIKKIEIIKENKTKENQERVEKAEEKIRNILKDFYNLSDDNININVSTND